MNRDVQALRDMLEQHDPSGSIGGFDPAEDARATAAFNAIVATPRPIVLSEPRHPSKPLSRRFAPGFVPALAVAIALIAVSVGTERSSTQAPVATPAMLDFRLVAAESASQLLDRMAQAADRQPALPPVGREFWYLRTANWHLTTAVSEKTTSLVRPRIQEVWVGANGSARVVEATAAPIPPADGSPASEKEAVNALPSGGGAVTTDYAPGEYSTGQRILSTDPAVLAQQFLSPNNPDIPDNVETLVAIISRLRQQPLPPPLLAAMYRVLGGLSGVEDAGTVTDRAGRPGVAIAMTSDYSGLPTRYVLIIDPDTAAPLANEQILTTDAGKLKVPIPSVSSYTTYVRTGTVPGIDARP